MGFDKLLQRLSSSTPRKAAFVDSFIYAAAAEWSLFEGKVGAAEEGKNGKGGKGKKEELSINLPLRRQTNFLQGSHFRLASRLLPRRRRIKAIEFVSNFLNFGSVV